ncbi:putative Cytochrome P450, partial [Melia azedarach]
LLSVPLLLLLLFQKYRRRRIVRRPPGPRRLPLIGNLHQFDSSNPPLYFQKLSAKHGALMSFRIGFVPTLIVSSGKLAREIFKTHHLQFSSRPTVLGRQTLSYNGSDLAFTPHGDYWREKRKIRVLHLFNSGRVQQFRPIREDEVSRMIEKISKLSAAAKPVNLSEIMLSFTSTVTCRLAFVRGTRTKELKEENFAHFLKKQKSC